MSEIENLLNNQLKNGNHEPNKNFKIGISAYRAVATEINRKATLRTVNIVDASFSCIRHAIITIFILPLIIWSYDELFILLKSP